MTNTAIFVISTGRCGTQWLARALRDACGEAAEVTHEPLHLRYAPRRMLGARDPSNLEPALAEAILAHVDRVGATLAQRSYIECGHPLWSTAPYLLQRFRGRACAVHLVRHPVATAWSWLTLQAYCPPLAPHLGSREPLTPFDDGVSLLEYRERWPALQPFEKCLYYWAEVNAFALRLERRGEAPWLRVRFEELTTTCNLQPVFALGRIAACGVAERTNVTVDDHRCMSNLQVDPGIVARHPAVLAIAAELGYDALDFDAQALRRRYSGAS